MAGMLMTESPIQLAARTRMRGVWVLAMADFADGIVKVLCATDNADLDSKVIDGNIATVDLGKADGVLFRGQDGRGTAFETAVDHVDDFLLRVAVGVGVARGVDYIGAEGAQALLKAFGN